MGVSKGAELSLLYASLRPEITSVIAFSPSNHIIGFGNTGTWTLKGEELEYLEVFDESVDNRLTLNEYNKINNSTAYIDALKNSTEKTKTRVENIKGPIYLFSGKDDELWPSSIMSNQIETRLKEKNFKYDYQNYQYDNCGHNIAPPPYNSIALIFENATLGGKKKEIAYAQLDAWKKVINHLNTTF